MSIFNFRFSIANCRRQRKCSLGFTLVEIIAATSILSIGAVGALGYQYFAVRQASVTHAQLTAIKIAQLLLEDWKSTGGSADYEPTALGFGFESITTPSNFGWGADRYLGAWVHRQTYAVTIDNVPLKVMLKWQDVQTDAASQTTLRQLSVVVNFDKNTDSSQSPAFYEPDVFLTTYARVDASGG